MAKYTKNITLGYDSNGKRIRKRITASSKTALAQMEYDLKREFEKSPSDMTFAEAVSAWLEIKQPVIEIATYNHYKTQLKHFASLNLRKLKDIKRIDIQRIINGLSLGSVSAASSVIKSMFTYYVDEELISSNPARKLDLPKQPKKIRNFLSDAQLESLRQANLDVEERAYVTILHSFGLRPGEAAALTASDFDFRKMQVTINKAVGYDHREPYLKSTKTGSIRSIPIPTDAVPAIKALIRQTSGLYLFGSGDFGLRTKTEMEKLWNHIAKKWQTGISAKVTPYIFRRTFATDLYYSGISIKKAAYYMGHADTTMIMQIYAQIDDEREGVEMLKARKTV